MDAVSGDETPVVGFVDGDDGTDDGPITDATVESVESVLTAHDATSVRGSLEDVLEADPSVVVAAGEATISAIARARSEWDGPVLPVGDVTGIEAVERDRLPGALEAMFEGTAITKRHPVLAVELETENSGGTEDEIDSEVRALFDVTLVTDEPARISEYGLSSRGESIATFRADGVVAATPAGSHGYASAVDAPHLSRAVDAVAVAPIAPFVTRTRRWVLPDDDLTITVERDESEVALVADDRDVGTVGVGGSVELATDGSLSTLTVPSDVFE